MAHRVPLITAVTDEEQGTAHPSSTISIQTLLGRFPGLKSDTTKKKLREHIISHDRQVIKAENAHLIKLKKCLEEEYKEKAVYSSYSLSQLLVYLPGTLFFALALVSAYGLTERNHALAELQNIKPISNDTVSCFDLNERQSGGCIAALTDRMLDACASACDSLSFNRDLFIMTLLFDTTMIPFVVLFTALQIADIRLQKSKQAVIEKESMEKYSVELQTEVRKIPELSLAMNYSECLKIINKLIKQNEESLKKIPSATKALVKKLDGFFDPKKKDLEVPLLHSAASKSYSSF